MKNFIPPIINNVLITEDVNLAIDFILLNSKKQKYLPILEPPRDTREDAGNEAIRINNSIARAKCNKVTYGNLNKNQVDLLDQQFHPQLITKISSKEELGSNSKTQIVNQNSLEWGNNYLGIWLLEILNEKKSLKNLHELESNNFFEGASGLLFIAENRNDITSIIVANYAYTFGASLLFVDKKTREKINLFNRELFEIYNLGKDVQRKLNQLIEEIKSFLPPICWDNYHAVTFFTWGIPYGLAFQQTPSSHIYIYPFLGVNLLNYIAIEQSNDFKLYAGLILNPGSFDNSEIPIVKKELHNRGMMLRLLEQEASTVFNTHLFMAAFPYDFLFISSHANEAKGIRKKYRFKDSENIERELVVDEAIGLGWDYLEKKYWVHSFTSFVSLDGIDWRNEDEKNKHYIGRAINEFVNIKKDNRADDYLISQEKVASVNMAMAYKMVDGIYIPLLHGLGDNHCPIIISNACSSWHKIASDTMVAGARAYIGPVIDITNFEAIELTKVMFTKHLNRPMSNALWRSQNEIYGNQNRKPYIYTGAHFAKFRFTSIGVKDNIIQRLSKSVKEWEEKAETTQNEDVRNNSKRFAKFMKDELSKLILG